VWSLHRIPLYHPRHHPAFAVTYFQFHALFILPPLLILALLARRRRLAWPAWRALLATAGIAIVYTTPWDNYLVREGIWSYGTDRVVGTIGYVPIEEYVFFLLLPAFVGLIYVLFFANDGPSSTGNKVGLALAWAFAGLALVGFALLAFASERWTYLGLILAWASPVLAGIWFFAGVFLGRRLRAVAAATFLPSAYLWVADRQAIAAGVWSIASDTSLGITPFGLPIEEATFFLMTHLLVVSGVAFFFHGERIATERRPPAPPDEPYLSPAMVGSPGIPEITVRELKEMMDRGEPLFLLDVRREDEYAFANLNGFLIRLDTLPARIDVLEPYREQLVVVYCRSGARSANAVQFLLANGFENVRNLRGGILAWSREIDPSIPAY
jgi:lycopene cyclase domain-containing protein